MSTKCSLWYLSTTVREKSSLFYKYHHLLQDLIWSTVTLSLVKCYKIHGTKWLHDNKKRVKVMNNGAPQLNSNTAPTQILPEEWKYHTCTDPDVPIQNPCRLLPSAWCVARPGSYTMLQIAAHIDEKQGKTCQKAFDWVIHFMASVKYQQATLWRSTMGLDLAVRPTISSELLISFISHLL